jgi:hypothetical protein
LPLDRLKCRSKESAGKPEENVAAGFIELVSPASGGNCCCTLELEDEAGAKMRIQLKSATMPVAAQQNFPFFAQLNFRYLGRRNYSYFQVVV